MKRKFEFQHRTLGLVLVSVAAVFVLLWAATYIASAQMVKMSAPEGPGAPLGGPPPQVVNYQGTINVDGQIYDGTGYFKFAVVDSASGDGTTNYWAHDGAASGEPTTYITRTVDNGLFNVMLGDTSVMSMTEVVSDTVFTDTDTYLRVWFSDTGGSFQALEPNQRFASVAYALRAKYAESGPAESDPVFSASPASGITSGQIGNWNTAFGWGNHATAGYDTTNDAWVGAPHITTTGKVGIGVSGVPATDLHIRENASTFTPQLLIDQIGTGDASVQLSQGAAAPAIYSLGIDSSDKNFKLTNTPNLTGGVGSTQGDAKTLIQAYPGGIVDFNNQSRARAFLTPGSLQLIFTGVWMPIQFDDDMTPLGGYDQQGEFTFIDPTGAPRASFSPTVEGYYQVHARTEFVEGEPGQYLPGGYVSIAIWVNGLPYAQGNNLQMVDSLGHILPNNNAPNVSDVVWLVPGDVLEVYVYQSVTALGPLILVPGPDKTYVSIHCSRERRGCREFSPLRCLLAGAQRRRRARIRRECQPGWLAGPVRNRLVVLGKIRPGCGLLAPGIVLCLFAAHGKVG